MAEKQSKKEPKKSKKSSKSIDYGKLNVNELRKEMVEMQIKVRTGEETDTSKVKKIRKEIARKLTIAKETK